MSTLIIDASREIDYLSEGRSAPVHVASSRGQTTRRGDGFSITRNSFKTDSLLSERLRRGVGPLTRLGIGRVSGRLTGRRRVEKSRETRPTAVRWGRPLPAAPAHPVAATAEGV